MYLFIYFDKKGLCYEMQIFFHFLSESVFFLYFTEDTGVCQTLKLAFHRVLITVALEQIMSMAGI